MDKEHNKSTKNRTKQGW